MREFPEKDWKLFRQKLPGWQEAYMTRLCEEYMELLRSKKKGSERFWELEKRIKEDQKKKIIKMKFYILQDIISKFIYSKENLIIQKIQ